MPPTMPKFQLARCWQPLAESFDNFSDESKAFAECAEAVLEEMNAIQRDVLAKAREVEQLAAQLALREQQLADQQCSFAELASRFDQQAAQLSDALEEMRNLRADLNRWPNASAAVTQARSASQEERIATHEEESLWRAELNDLRLLIHEATAGTLNKAEHVEPIVAAPAAQVTPAEAMLRDPVANSVMAQFAKLHKDSARRRTNEHTK